MTELWQLYSEDGKPLAGEGGNKDTVYGEGLLHGAAHVWIWRRSDKGPEVLLQKRAASKRTWSNLFDISAAGHIDLGESPKEAAVRETVEEIGLSISHSQLYKVGVHRFRVDVDEKNTENEFRWVFLLELHDETKLKLQESEVALTKWITLSELESGVLPNSGDFVPQGDDYYEMVVNAIKSQST